MGRFLYIRVKRNTTHSKALFSINKDRFGNPCLIFSNLRRSSEAELINQFKGLKCDDGMMQSPRRSISPFLWILPRSFLNWCFIHPALVPFGGYACDERKRLHSSLFPFSLQKKRRRWNVIWKYISDKSHAGSSSITSFTYQSWCQPVINTLIKYIIIARSHFNSSFGYYFNLNMHKVSYILDRNFVFWFKYFDNLKNIILIINWNWNNKNISTFWKSNRFI